MAIDKGPGVIGRRCVLEGMQELRPEDLFAGMDFRLPQHRRATFLRFYEFHLRYRSHPGCIYYLFPYLAERHGWDLETRLWFAFLNGNTQNPVTSWLIFREFPELPRDAAAMDRFESWFRGTYKRLAFDTDRRYHKTKLPEATARYREVVGRVGSQVDYFASLTTGRPPQEGFGVVWKAVERDFLYFGRLSAFSYLEYLRVMGIGIECSTLFLDDRAGSRSHRNGLCKVLGRDDLDWHDSNPDFDGRYPRPLVEWLEYEGELLLREARRRFAGRDFERDVGYFTLESTFCTYKGWHRPNRRYPNVYNDMLVGRIKEAEAAWGEPLELFWEARAAALPDHLLLEKNPADPGVEPRKQNHYLQTGQVIMMDREWPCFRNDFNDEVRRAQGES